MDKNRSHRLTTGQIEGQKVKRQDMGDRIDKTNGQIDEQTVQQTNEQSEMYISQGTSTSPSLKL